VALVEALRPSQWAKNVVVLVPAFFALWDRAQQKAAVAGRLWPVVLATVAFCLASSGIYVLNDLCDVAQDRLHPRKRFRPLAAGRLSPVVARSMVPVLLLSAAALGLMAHPRFLAVLGLYVAMQVCYSLGLKRVGLLDVFVIAAGFVLRAIGGAEAAQVRVSAWLLLCTFLLALFLAVCKRRHEKANLLDGGAGHRAALEQYDLRALDQYIAITAAATVISYAVYTLAPETVEKFGTRALGFTVPFVVFGVFRYMDLLYRQSEGERPEKVLLTDPPMIATVLLYAAAAVAAFLWGQIK
jgi:4-hydroxybenzoate polyprenyltransferase